MPDDASSARAANARGSDLEGLPRPVLRRLLFAFFVLSGFSGLLYQIVWVRMALASFGVITPFASLVVSVFMLGLALGSWLGGRWVGPLAGRLRASPILLYGLAELGIGIGAFALPWLFAAGRALLLPIGAMDGQHYLLLSSLVITLTMLPWCLCMGATFPTMMAFIEREDDEPSGSFSFLYLANVIGAMAGVIATSVVLIELLGFRASLSVAACLNVAVAAACFWLARRHPWRPAVAADAAATTSVPVAEAGGPRSRVDVPPGLATLVLFVTGFASMALEIVWLRAYTPVLGTLVYAFAGILAVYLLATWLGSMLYRRGRERGSVWSMGSLACLLAPAAVLPILAGSPRHLSAATRPLVAALAPLIEVRPVTVSIALTLLSLFPFCALLGQLTPMLIDEDARGRPARAGRSYAINITGSILGPLAAAYWLLPWLGARLSMVALALPFCALFLWYAVGPASRRRRLAWAAAALATGFVLIEVGVRGHSFEEGSPLAGAVVRRDHTATVISHGRGFRSRLLVNGQGMTVLTPVTKVMAHLPLVSLDHPPERALVIAFGMGTTFRSLLSWDIETTAVELVPSVVEAFGYYHSDADLVRHDPRGTIVVDDGRRFLARSETLFDLITVDPPPPVEAAGSSLLYAEEFYELAKHRLAPGGIVQAWFPDSPNVEPLIRQAALRSVLRSFPHVRVFRSMQGMGLHILASLEPIVVPDSAAFVAAMPPEARRDLMEWEGRDASIHEHVRRHILDNEIPLERLIADPGDPRWISDDRPLNEYFLLRRLLGDG